MSYGNYFILYTRQDCEYCDKAIALLHGKNKKYVLYELEDNDTLIGIKNKYGWPTVPVILEVDEDREKIFIGGYDNLLKHIGG